MVMFTKKLTHQKEKMDKKKLNAKKLVSNKKKLTKPANVRTQEIDMSELPASVVKKHEQKLFAYKKRHPISRTENNWNINDAKKAIFLEKMFMERQQKNPTLIINFPDKKLNPSIVRGFSSNIDSVSFMQSAAPRVCYVTLKPGSNVKDEIKKISKIPFQNGFLKAKVRRPQTAPDPIPREVDPSTLYIGNLPADISVAEIKEHFPKATRIDVGYCLKRKWRRYALVKYSSSEEAMHAFAISYESNIRSTSLVVRFHRKKNWNILEEVEIQNEIERLKVKKEKIDEEYEAAIRKAKVGCNAAEGPTRPDSPVFHFVRAQFPIARPMIDPLMIKQEPVSPEYNPHEVEFSSYPEETNENWNQSQHQLQFMASNQPQYHVRSQVQAQQYVNTQQQLFPEQSMPNMQQNCQTYNPEQGWNNMMVSAPNFEHSSNPMDTNENWNQKNMSQSTTSNQPQYHMRTQVPAYQYANTQQQLYQEQLMPSIPQKSQVYNPICGGWNNTMVSSIPNTQQAPPMESIDLNQRNQRVGSHNEAFKLLRDSQQNRNCSTKPTNYKENRSTIDPGQPKIDIRNLPRIPKKRAHESDLKSTERSYNSASFSQNTRNRNSSLSGSSSQNHRGHQISKNKRLMQNFNDSKRENTKMNSLVKPNKMVKRTMN